VTIAAQPFEAVTLPLVVAADTELKPGAAQGVQP
jgi:hypothetical protein